MYVNICISFMLYKIYFISFIISDIVSILHTNTNIYYICKCGHNYSSYIMNYCG